MTIHKEGYSTLFVVLVLLLVLNAGIYYIGGIEIIKYTTLVSLIFYFWIVNFFRSPKREAIVQEGAVVAPADGTIVAIEEVDENEYLKTRCIQVSIFMSIFNVHINWFPIKGVVKYCRHHNGRFQAAYLPKSSIENERTTVVIENNKGVKLLVRQIAGALARRIVCYGADEKKVMQGEQMGFIKFGSRVDMFFPLGSRIDVKMDQKVTGRQTIIGWLD